MDFVRYIDPYFNETPESIVLHNIKIANKIENYEIMVACIIKWLKLNEDKNLYNLELLFRSLNLKVQLYAKKPTNKDGLSLFNKKTNDFNYECHITFNKIEIDPEDNLEKLKSCGLHVDLDKLIYHHDDIYFTNKQNDLIDQILNNNKKLIIYYVSLTRILKMIKKDIYDKFGQEPDIIKYHELPDDTILDAFCINNLRVSKYCIKTNGKKKSVVYVD